MLSAGSARKRHSCFISWHHHVTETGYDSFPECKTKNPTASMYGMLGKFPTIFVAFTVKALCVPS